MAVEMVRTIDLFCGCGGLSLGFDLYDGLVRYDVVMALDNESQAVTCYNVNRPQPLGGLPVARVCDLTWFSHPSEVLLYYLLHLSLSRKDAELQRAFEGPSIGVPQFLATLRQIDLSFAQQCVSLNESQPFRTAIDSLDATVFTLAITKAFFARLNLTPPRSGAISVTALPWKEEYEFLNTTLRIASPTSEAASPAIHAGCRAKWEAEVRILLESSQKEGSGANKGMAKRLKPLVAFLVGDQGQLLRDAWLDWRSQRDTCRATFCLEAEQRLAQLYADGRQVHLLLGGPPCKGFSRIGRAVIANLRQQGTHAWANSEYGDERNTLLHKYVLFLQALQPDVFVFENVRHFTSALKTPSRELDPAALLGETIEELSLNSVHYEVASRIVHCREHAIPQDRERFFMVGFNGAGLGKAFTESFFDLPRFEEEVPLQVALAGLEPPGKFTFGVTASCKPDHQSKAYTLLDEAMPASHVRYVCWIRQPRPGEGKAPATTDAHIVRTSRPDDQALIEMFAPGRRWMDYKLTKARTLVDLRAALEAVLVVAQGGRCPDLPAEEQVIDLLNRVDEGLLLRLMMEELDLSSLYQGEHHLLSKGYLEKGNDSHGDWFERLRPGRPCKTVVAHIGKDTYGYIHPWEHRAISIREAARVQSFPDFFGFGTAGVVNGYAMIGNAVPPLLSSMFADRLASMHNCSRLFGVPKPNAPARKPTKQRRIEQRTLFTPPEDEAC